MTRVAGFAMVVFAATAWVYMELSASARHHLLHATFFAVDAHVDKSRRKL